MAAAGSDSCAGGDANATASDSTAGGAVNATASASTAGGALNRTAPHSIRGADVDRGAADSTPGVAFVTGADRGLGRALVARLLAAGWRVVAGRYGGGPAVRHEQHLDSLIDIFPETLLVVPLDVTNPDSVARAAGAATDRHRAIDLLINNAGILDADGVHTKIGEGLPYEGMFATYAVNAIGPIRVTEALLPVVERSAMRRVCFVSSEAGSIGASGRTAWYGYTMSKAALNMAVKVMWNDLRPRGFSFRLYHPGWMQTWMSGSENTEATLTPDEAAARALAYFLSDEVPEEPLTLRDDTGAPWPW